MPDHDWEGGDYISRCRACKLLHTFEGGERGTDEEFAFIAQNDDFQIVHESWHNRGNLKYVCPGRDIDLMKFTTEKKAGR